MSIAPPSCKAIPDVPAQLSVTLPGGLAVTSMPVAQGAVMTASNAVQSVLVQLGPALAALQPVFVLIDTVTALKDTVQAIPGLIAGDAETFMDAVSRVVSGVGKLAGMAPAASVPVLIRDAVKVITAAIDAMLGELAVLQSMVAQANDIRALADTMPQEVASGLLSQAECIDEQGAVLLEHAIVSLGPVGNLIAILNSLAELASMPGLPELADLSGAGLDEVVTALNALKSVLEAIP
jgi:hypothetical protein